MSFQWISRSIWSPSRDCTSEKQQVYHSNLDDKKKVKWTLSYLLDLKLCDGQYPFQLITDHFHFLWAVGKKIIFPHREGCGTEEKTMGKRNVSCPHSPVQPSARVKMFLQQRADGGCLGSEEKFPVVRARQEQESLKGIWGRHRGVCWNNRQPGAGLLEEDHLWDTEGAVQHFCSLKVEHYCIGNQSERKTAPSGQKRGMR